MHRLEECIVMHRLVESTVMHRLATCMVMHRLAECSVMHRLVECIVMHSHECIVMHSHECIVMHRFEEYVVTHLVGIINVMFTSDSELYCLQAYCFHTVSNVQSSKIMYKTVSIHLVLLSIETAKHNVNRQFYCIHFLCTNWTV